MNGSAIGPEASTPLASDAAVTVVIPARRAETLLPDCLDVVLSQLHADDEVLISAGDPGTATVARERASRDPRIRVLDNVAGTTPAALNLAISEARHPVLVRVDAQSRIPPGYRDRVVELLRTTGAVTVGGRQVAMSQKGTGAAIAAAMNSRLGHGGAAYRSGSAAGPVDTVYLGAFRTDVLRRIGGYDERFTTNQDAELNERLRRAGGSVWLDPDLMVGYWPRTTLRALFRQFLGYGRGRAMTARRHPGSLRPRQVAAPVFVASLGVSLLVLPWTSVPLALLAGGYCSLLLLATILEGPEARHRLPVVLVAIMVMHLAWGYGFLTAPRSPERGAGEPRGLSM